MNGSAQLIKKHGLDEACVQRIALLNMEISFFKNQMRQEANQEMLREYNSHINNLQFELQEAWGFSRNRNFHKFWAVPKCTCPREYNEKRYPRGGYKTNRKCVIHGEG